MIVVDGPDKMNAVNAADKLFCRFKMRGCPHCVNTQADWDSMSALAGPALTPGAVLAEIEADMAPFFKARMGNGSKYTVESFPTYSFFKKGVFKGEAKNARTKGALLSVLKKRGFLKTKGTRKSKGKKKKTRKV